MARMIRNYGNSSWGADGGKGAQSCQVALAGGSAGARPGGNYRGIDHAESGVRAHYSLGERPSAHYHKAALQYFRCFSESAITRTRTARCMKLPKAKTNKLLPGY